LTFTITIVFAIVGCLLVAFVRPVVGLAVYVILSMWYPYGVGTISVGTIDFSVGRIVIIALFVKIFLSADLTKNFKVIWLDRLVVILFVAEILAGFTTTEPMKLIEYRSGDFFDMALPYFAVRLIITSKNQYISLLKAIAWAAGILATFAFYESLTGHNLLALGRNLGIPDIRMTFFHRAQTTFRHAIYYGIFSAMTGALCLGLLKIQGQNKTFYKILIGLCFLGAFSSMSSGGQLAIIGALLFIGFFRYRYYWKQAIVGVIIMCGLVEVISNRHFYDVLARFTFNPATAWYRGRLFEVAVLEGGMSGHWLFGYGYADPGWGALIDGNRTDIVNHYVLQLCWYGLVGFIPFCALIITAIKNLFQNFWVLSKEADSWMIWCIAGSLCSVLLANHSVALFGMPMTMLYMIFGLCVAVPSIVGKNNSMGFIDQALLHR